MTAAEMLFRGKIICPCESCGEVRAAFAKHPPTVFDVQNVMEYMLSPGGIIELKPIDAPGCFCPWSTAILSFPGEQGCSSGVIVGVPEDDDHCFQGLLFITVAGGEAAAPIGAFTVELDASGNFTNFYTRVHAEGQDEGKLELIVSAGAIAMMSFSFANCRNVRSEKISPSRQVRRQSERRREAVFEHYVLCIDPMKQILRVEGGIAQNGLVKALHICRGHFATYDERPLFGKLKGRFWIPQHVRGSQEAGLVTKDYVVEKIKRTSA